MIFLLQFGINNHLSIFQRPQIALALRACAILLVFEKIYSCLFIPNYTRNHVIAYANSTWYDLKCIALEYLSVLWKTLIPLKYNFPLNHHMMELNDWWVNFEVKNKKQMNYGLKGSYSPFLLTRVHCSNVDTRQCLRIMSRPQDRCSREHVCISQKT